MKASDYRRSLILHEAYQVVGVKFTATYASQRQIRLHI